MTNTIRKGAEFLVTEISENEVFTPELLSDEHKQMADTTRQYVNEHILPDLEKIDLQDFKVVLHHMKTLGELGLFAVDIPEAYGGLDLDKVSSVVIVENIAPSGSFSVIFSAHTGIGTLPVVYYGTEAQKEKYLEKLATGEYIGAYCLTEPNAGSDALSSTSSAKLSENGKYYLLNGTKQFITNAGFADLFTIFAKIDGEQFTAFLVERNFPGLSIDVEENKLGIKGASTCAVIMDNLQVPVENILGTIGKGHKIAFNILNFGRFKLGAAVVGASKSALMESLKYANQRKQFKVPISSFGAIQEKLTCMVGQIFAAESLIYRIAGILDHRIETLDINSPDYYSEYEKSIEEYTVECAIAKVFCSDILADVVDHMVQIYGGYGYVQGYPAERYYRDERINRIFEGTNEINRLIITGTILKKAEKDLIPLKSAAMQAIENLITPDFEEPDEETPFAQELDLLNHLKQIFLIIAGSAVQKFGPAIKKEQEVMLAVSNIVIQIFSLESSILRAKKVIEDSTEVKKTLLLDVVKYLSFTTTEIISSEAKKAAFYLEEGDNLQILLSGIRRYSKYNARGLLESSRNLSLQSIKMENYPF